MKQMRSDAGGSHVGVCVCVQKGEKKKGMLAQPPAGFFTCISGLASRWTWSQLKEEVVWSESDLLSVRRTR